MVEEDGKRGDQRQQGPGRDHPKLFEDLSKERLQNIYAEQDPRKQFE